jgi:Kef-type K+ transport system membrane component KefB
VDVRTTLETLLAVSLVAFLAPVVIPLLPGPRVPQVVLLLIGGMIIGPEVLGVGDPESVQILADVGLGFLFLLAGYEVDQRLFRQDAGRRAVLSWFVTVGLASAAVGVLHAIGVVRAFVPVAIALTTTALGTLLPILREHHLLRGRLGQHLLASGAVGELLPIIAVALFLGANNRFVALGSLAAVLAVAVGLTFLARGVRGRLRRILEEGQHETTQVTVRGTVLLLTLLLAVTEQFHLDAVLGAFLAGMVLRRWAGAGLPSLEGKLDALGYGFFIPIFFVYSGMSLDLEEVISAPLRVFLFAGLMLLVHVVPVFALYRRELVLRERWQMAFVVSTALPLVVAIAEIGRRNGTMLPENAAALVGAGVLTVLVFPAIAVALRRAAPVERPAVPGPEDAPDRAQPS